MVAYITTPTGAGIIADNAHVPADSANRDWQAKLATEASEGIDPAPPLYLAIADAIESAVQSVNVTAARLRHAAQPTVATFGALFYLRHQEAIAADADGTPTEGEYPLLHAEVPQTAASIALVADAVIAEVAAVKASWAPIEDVRVTTIAALEACANQAQIDAIISAIEWPA